MRGYLFGAKGAVSFLAWGIVPGIRSPANQSAESAIQSGGSPNFAAEAKRAFSAGVLGASTNPGALPQALGEFRAFGAKHVHASSHRFSAVASARGHRSRLQISKRKRFDLIIWDF